MSLVDSLFEVNGKKVSSLLVAEDAFLLSSQSFNSAEDFKQAWGKTLTLATKTEIKYSAIKLISKEDASDSIMIKYKGTLNMPSECEFSFTQKDAVELLFDYVVKEQYFSRSDERLSPIKAATPYLIGLAATIGFTVFSHYQAIAIENGTVEESGSRKTRAFNHLIELIGDKGVWAVGGIITAYVGYRVWQRFSNPPVQTKFLPPNG